MGYTADVSMFPYFKKQGITYFDKILNKEFELKREIEKLKMEMVSLEEFKEKAIEENSAAAVCEMFMDQIETLDKIVKTNNIEIENKNMTIEREIEKREVIEENAEYWVNHYGDGWADYVWNKCNWYEAMYFISREITRGHQYVANNNVMEYEWDFEAWMREQNELEVWDEGSYMEKIKEETNEFIEEFQNCELLTQEIIDTINNDTIEDNDLLDIYLELHNIQHFFVEDKELIVLRE
tara:strand:- start:168 stop:881 length:714 start_codon:yes stop_codon:yes gene_type:complete